jgi:hypothetical protein
MKHITISILTLALTWVCAFGQGSLGTMSLQNSNAVTITGGTINGVVIGGVTPAASTHTTLTVTANGAASTPSVRLSGTAFSGGSASTTQPLWLAMPTGTSWTNGTTAGTMLGVNAASGFTGNLLDLQTNNTRAFAVDRVGQVTFLTQISGPSYHESAGNSFYANSAAGGVATKNTGFFGFSSDGTAFGTLGPRIRAGAGSPEGAITAPVGSLYLRTDGGANTTLYVKESGAGNTGWVAK